MLRILAFVPLLAMVYLCIYAIIFECSPPALACSPYISPANPTAADNLVCYPTSDQSQDVSQYEYQWYKDGELQPDLDANVVHGFYMAKGESWVCEVRDRYHKAYGSVSAVIGNSIPSIPEVTFIEPYAGVQGLNGIVALDIITYSRDVDKDTLTYSYDWYCDGRQLDTHEMAVDILSCTSDSIPANWKCIVTVSDGITSVSTALSSQITIDPIDGVPVLSSPVCYSAVNMKAMYLRYPALILTRGDEQDRFFAVCAEEQINVVFVTLETKDLEVCPAFIARAKSVGIGIHVVVAGTRDTLLVPDLGQEIITGILKYNIENPSCRFEGINWDIEKGFEDRVVYGRYIQEVKKFAYEYQTIVSQHLCLSLHDVGIDTSGVETLWSEFAVIVLDGAQDALLDGPRGGVVGRLGDGPTICQQIGKPFVVYLETNYLGDRPTVGYDITRDTLYEEGKIGCNALCEQIDGYSEGNNAYVGYSLDSYVGVRTWTSILN